MHSRNQKLIWLGAGAILLGAICWLSFATPILTNVIGLASEKVYIIPDESSVWRFEPTEMNTGSGDWWIYGKDPMYFYFFEGAKDVAYQAFKRSDVTKCPDFDPHNHETWCENLVLKRKSSRITEFWQAQ